MNNLYLHEMQFTADALEKISALLESDDVDPYKYARATGILLARVRGFASTIAIVEKDELITAELERIRAIRV